MNRFFLTDTPLASEEQVDLAPIARQLRSVLRLQPGAQIILLDGENQAFLTEITQLEQSKATGHILAQETLATEPTARLALYQCSLKADKFEWVLQKGTELGVSRFVPVVSERSVVRPLAALQKKRARWNSIVREAAEQSGRGILPDIAEPVNYKQAIQDADGLRLLPWEDAGKGGKVVNLGRRLQQSIDAKAVPQKVSILVGPEGGLSRQEVDVARGTGWDVVSLGARILRAETASVAAVSIAMDRMGEMGC